MNLIVVGAGGHAQSWKQNVNRHPDWDVVAIVDTDTEKLDHVGTWGVSEDEAYTTIADAVKWTDRELHCALITTPIPTHFALAVEALENGLNVILEKNMAQTIEQGQTLVKLARKHPDLGTAIGTQYRYRPTWWTLRKLFLEKQSPIGPLSHFHFKSTAFSGDTRGGWRHFMPHIFPSDMMVHHVDSIRYATGLEVVQVQAKIFKPAWSKWLGTSTVFMNFTMAPPGREDDVDSWVHGQYHGDWQARGLKHDWEDACEFYGPAGSIRIEPREKKEKEAVWMDIWETYKGVPLIGEPSGSRLVAYVDDASNKCVHVREIEKDTDVARNGKDYVDQLCILEEMKQCIESGGKKQPGTCFEDGFKSYLVTRAAILSSRENKTIWLPDYWP
ncbi:MAG: Gfo/Idh/MocA family protein [Promethearchaeota archaeon]